LYFYLSKILAPLLNPTNILFLALIILFTLYCKNRKKIIFRLLAINIFVLLFISFLPIGNFGLKYLENDFVNREQYENIDNIIVLSGSDYRLLASVKLGNKYKNTVIYYVGGNAYLIKKDINDEIIKAKKIYEELNFDMRRVIFVSQSRNTIENFKEIEKLNLLDSKTVLITSAYHMKRSIIIAKEFDFHPIPYVVDPKINRQNSLINIYQDFNISTNLSNFNLFFRETIGIIVFKLSS
tara:strand:- start:105 stop:821 length:717 start_codon:yes stop_codon:yes gene_type:complete